MADEYHDVNKYAHEGGDTAPGTREQIGARNKAADKLAEVSRQYAADREKSADEHSQKLAKAQDEFNRAVASPEVVPPSRGAGAPRRDEK